MTGARQSLPDQDSGNKSDSGSSAPRVLLGYAGGVIAGAVQRILSAHGFEVGIAHDAETVERSLAGGGWDALVVDVALPGGFELTAPARRAGVKCVILVASVFRRTSYKRRPRRLYGADDYVEIHHLGDHLPRRLRSHLGLGDSELPAETLREVLATLHERGDERLLEQTPRGLAMLIVADLLLYNGDRINEANSVEEAFAAIGRDLDGARELFEQLQQSSENGSSAEGSAGSDGRDLIDDAFRELVSSLDGSSNAGDSSNAGHDDGPGQGGPT